MDVPMTPLSFAGNHLRAKPEAFGPFIRTDHPRISDWIAFNKFPH